jgi:hypothetical protein
MRCLAVAGCLVLGNLAFCNLGKEKAVKSGGLQAPLTAVNNLLHCAYTYEYACWALLEERKEQTELLIGLFGGGGAAVAKVRKERPDNDNAQSEVRHLAKLIGTEINSWAEDEE